MRNAVRDGAGPMSLARNDAQVDRNSQTGRRLIAGGSLIGAIVASSCCIVPLVLVSLGLGGAWLGNLTALEPYKPYFVAGTVMLLGAGYWQVYVKPNRACAPGSFCARPASGRLTKAVLWLATLVVLLAATISYWAPLFY